ncbi:MAG: GHKL domain-containing protein [Bacteroidetes bacterium]|nr:GHKL domain-containing protein [Bacteroidota bacterium]
MKIKEALSTWAIAEQPNGSLYVAAELLLAQYDGTKFVPVANCQAASLAVDKDGVAYVGGGGEFGMVSIDKKGKYSFKRLSNLLGDSAKLGAVRHIYITSKYIYFCTIEAIYEYEKGTQHIKTYLPQTNGLFFNGFVINDEFFISQRLVGLQKIVNGELVMAPFGDKVSWQVTSSIEFKTNERLLATGRDGKMIRYFYDPKTPPTPFILKEQNYLVGDAFFDSSPFNKDYFIVGTLAHGALLIDSEGKIAAKYNDSSFFQGQRVVSVAKDRTSNIWLGYYGLQGRLSKTESGLDMSQWNKSNGLVGSVVSSIRSQGKRFVGTDNNLFYIDSKNQAVKLMPDVHRVSQMINFKIDDKEKLLAVTDEFHHLFEVNGTTMRAAFSGLEITSIAQSKINPRRLYVSMRDTLLAMRYENNRFVREKIIDLSKGNYRQIIENTDGSLWLLEDNNFGAAARVDFLNVNDLSVKSMTRFTSADGLPEYCTTLASLSGKIIVCSKKGLSWYNSTSKRFEPYTGLGKTFSDGQRNIQGLYQSKDGSVYVLPLFPSEKNDIVKIYVNSKGDTVYENRPFKRFPEFGYYSELNLEDDVLWLSGTEGLIRYDQRKDTRNYDLDFQCLIRQVISTTDTLLWGGQTAAETATQHASLPFDKNTISFDYAAPFFDGEPKTIFAVKLEGEDKEWSAWSATTQKSYSRLSEGTYTFQVKAKNIYGKESSIASYTFTIQPPWFRTWWAYALYSTGFILFVIGIVRWRTYSLYQKKAELERIVKEKTHELSESNKSLEASQEELRQNNDELLATNEHLKLTQQQLVAAEKMASLGQLTAGIAHEINNPINFISGGVQALKEIQNEIVTNGKGMTDGELEERKKESDEIMSSITNGVVRVSSIIKGLRTFSSPVESVEQDSNVELKECIDIALVLINKKISDMGIQLTKNIVPTSSIKANSAQLSQVFVNLIDNAIYAVKNKEEKLISIETSESVDEVILKVKDNGIGITPEAQKHLFEPFYTTKEVGAGTGLGLFICHTIIQRHNGKITVRSIPNVGTEFIVSLPKSKVR